MSVQERGFGGVVAEIDGTTYRAKRYTGRPIDYGSGGIYSISLTSGTIGAALAADSEIFQFRYVTAASRKAVIYAVGFSAGALVAATAAGLQSVKMTVARAWTAAGSGGNRAVLTGNNAKLRTSMATSEVNDAGVSSTAALTAGTKTLDSTDIAGVSIAVGTGAITTAVQLPLCSRSLIFDALGGDRMPLVLSDQEGFVLRSRVSNWAATMTWNCTVDVLWAEVSTF